MLPAVSYRQAATRAFRGFPGRMGDDSLWQVVRDASVQPTIMTLQDRPAIPTLRLAGGAGHRAPLSQPFISTRTASRLSHASTSSRL